VLKTPTDVAVELWGKAEGHSRSPGARKVRLVARELFGYAPPSDGRRWLLTDAQVATIRRRLA